jgi:integrase
LDLLRKAETGQPVDTSSRKLADYLTYWLAEVVKPTLRPTTYAMYETFVRLYISPALGSKRLDRLNVADVRRFIAALQAQGASPRKVQAARAILRSALSNAVTEELISRNVATLVKVPRPPRYRLRPWEAEEARTFLAATTAHRLHAAYVLVLTLGLRRGEVLGLGWDEVDLERGEIHVLWQIQRINGELRRVRVKTDNSDDVIPLPPICVEALRAKEATRRPGDVLVFTSAAGTPVDPRNFNRSFTLACHKADVRRIRVHDTRHTCASLLRSLGVDLSVIKDILRHSQISITADVYIHVTTEQQREAVALVGATLALPPSP